MGEMFSLSIISILGNLASIFSFLIDYRVIAVVFFLAILVIIFYLKGRKIKRYVDGLNVVDVDKIVEIEERARTVWIFTPDLRIDIKHNKFYKVIQNNLIKVKKKEKEYKYILPSSIDPHNIKDFKKRFGKKILEISKDNKDVDMFFDELFHIIPADKSIRNIIQETVLYDPEDPRDNGKIFKFPPTSTPLFAYEETNLDRRRELKDGFKKRWKHYKNIVNLEKEAKYIYVITEDLSLDLDPNFVVHVRNNLQLEIKGKNAPDKKDKFFECKYKYIILISQDSEKKSTLNSNLELYKSEILKGSSVIAEEELFLIVEFPIDKDLLGIFGAIFQERTIYINGSGLEEENIYYQIIKERDKDEEIFDKDYIKCIPLENKNLVHSFKDSFEYVWQHSFQYIKRKLCFPNNKDKKKGREFLIHIIIKITVIILERRDREYINKLSQILERVISGIKQIMSTCKYDEAKKLLGELNNSTNDRKQRLSPFKYGRTMELWKELNDSSHYENNIKNMMIKHIIQLEKISCNEYLSQCNVGQSDKEVICDRQVTCKNQLFIDIIKDHEFFEIIKKYHW